MKYLVLALWSLCLAATSVAAQSDYRVQPGDTLAIEVLEDRDLNRSLLVLPDGTINFPFAGTLRAGGRSVSQIQAAITQAIARNFAAPPTVFVTVASVRPPVLADTAFEPETIDIFFTGEINTPGARAVEPGTTFLQAISLSGGFTRFAATKRVQLRRVGHGGNVQTFSVNYRALSDGAALENDIILQDGDVILVPERRLFE